MTSSTTRAFMAKKQSTSFAQVATNLLNVLQGYSKSIRLLLVLFLTLTVSTAWGATYTLGWGSASGTTGTYTNFTNTSGTVDGVVSFSTAKNDGTTAPAYNSNNSDLRLYYNSKGNGGSITLTPVTGVTITGFVMTTSTAPTVKYKVGSGNLTAVSKASNANTYTVTDISVTSSNALTIQNANTSNTQLRIKTIQITYTKSGGNVAVSSISLDPSALSLEVGEESTLTAIVSPNNATNKNVTWSSSNTSIATVDNGVVTAKSVGSATITVKTEDGSKTATCNVTVTEPSSGGDNSECEWVETAIGDIKATDVVVIATYHATNGTYAISSSNGSSSAPSATKVTVSDATLTGNIADDLKWNISNSSGTLTIYPNGTTSNWLYCTATNNGVRVGTNENKAFTIDATSGYLKNTATSRYLGVYNKQDWRCYTNTTGNTADQTLKFYVQQCTTETSRYLTPKHRGDSGGTWLVVTEW